MTKLLWRVALTKPELEYLATSRANRYEMMHKLKTSKLTCFYVRLQIASLEQQHLLLRQQKILQGILDRVDLLCPPWDGEQAHG